MPTDEQMRADRQQAAAWAGVVLDGKDILILDTETTGLGRDAEICQIAIITMTGQVLLDTLVNPRRPVDPDAAAIHGLTDEKLMYAPPFGTVAIKLREILSGATVLIYNADFDTRLLEQSARAAGLEIDLPLFGAYSYDCVMQQYSAWCNEWSSYHGNYRWQKLPGGDHTALGDALATLAVIKRMADRPEHDITIKLRPSELRAWEYTYGMQNDLATVLQEVFIDLLGLPTNHHIVRRWLIFDWHTLYRIERNTYPKIWNDVAVMQRRIEARAQWNRGNDSWSRVRSLLVRLTTESLTKEQMRGLASQAFQAMKEAEETPHE